MSAFTDERNRILRMVETGQITAEQAAQLLDAMGSERERPRADRARSRTVRIRVTNSAAGATGRLLDIQDLEAGERVEIFAE